MTLRETESQIQTYQTRLSCVNSVGSGFSPDIFCIFIYLCSTTVTFLGGPMVWPVTPDLLVTLAFQSYSLKLCVLLSALLPKKSTLDRKPHGKVKNEP